MYKEQILELKFLLEELKVERETLTNIEDWKGTLCNILSKFIIRQGRSTLPTDKTDLKNIPYKIYFFFNNKKVRVDLYLRGSVSWDICINWSLSTQIGFHDDKLGKVKALLIFLDPIIEKLEKKCKRQEYLQGYLNAFRIIKAKTKGIKFNFDIPKVDIY